MSQQTELKKPIHFSRGIFVVLSHKKSRSILEILHTNKHLSYSELMESWRVVNDYNKHSWHSGLFPYHLRKVRHYNLIRKEISTKHYHLSFKGKKIYEAIDLINKAEKINLGTYPSCIKIRVSDFYTDEELLNSAVERILKEIKKLKVSNLG